MLWSAARRCGPDGDRPLLENAGKKKTPPRRLCTPCRAINDRLGFPEEGGEGEGMDGDVPSLRLPLLMSVCWTRRCKCSLPPSDTRCLLVLALFCFPCTNDVCVCVCVCVFFPCFLLLESYMVCASPILRLLFVCLFVCTYMHAVLCFFVGVFVSLSLVWFRCVFFPLIGFLFWYVLGRFAIALSSLLELFYEYYRFFLCFLLRWRC